MKHPKLRDYQNECIKVVYDHFKKHDKQLIQLPTGSGKTWIFLNYLKKYSRKALIICPSVELQEQIFRWAKVFLDDRCVVSKDRYRNKKPDVLIVTSQSLNFQVTSDYICSLDFDHIVIDEAHHAQAKTYVNFLKKFKTTHKFFKLLGCTATPERMDGKCLLDIFDTFTYDRNIIDMIKQGYLCDIEATRYRTEIKLARKNYNTGDFSKNVLKTLDISSRNNLIVKIYEENCLDKKTLIFCVNVTHALSLANILKTKGYSAEAIYGDMSQKQRDAILKRFKDGETQILTNCQLLTEGFDEPSIEALIMARPTASKSLYCQMIGRGLRKYPGKDVCYLHELTDNAHGICTFMVAAGKDPEKTKDIEYKERTRLTEFKDHLDTLTDDDIELKPEKYNIFENEIPVEDNGISLLTSIFYNQEQNKNQLNFTKNKEYNSLEAAFLMWKDKLKRKYGHG